MSARSGEVGRLGPRRRRWGGSGGLGPASRPGSARTAGIDDGPDDGRSAGAGGWPLALGLVGGALADAAFGDPRRWHPVAGFGRIASGLELRVWRPSRLTGTGYALTLVGATAAAAWAVDGRFRRRPLGRALLTGALTWTALGGRSLGGLALDLAARVREGDLEAARAVLPSLAGRDPDSLDGPELCRAAVESVAENTADAIIGPVLWGAIAGPAGIAGYRAANTLDAMVGHRSSRYLRFGWASARLDDLLGWAPARLGGALACALAPAVGGDRSLAFATMRRDGAAHPSPNAGRLEAAYAGALDVGLGGRNRYGERVEQRPELGDGPPPGPADVERAARLAALTGAAATLIAAAAAVALAKLRSRR
jgi:adenosylcobinamide-phosphate synthase